jgi:2-methylisocitrate lyase-like PEP mutase family enzyme
MTTLRKLFQRDEMLVAPGVFDMISAKVADSFDFDVLYMTGYGVVASHLGLPDAGLATYTDMVSRVRQIAGGVKAPLVADGDTGYGGLLNLEHTVIGYEAAGAAAIQIEDQEFPKKCGHMAGRRVIPLEDMVQKIRVAKDTRSSDDFLIVARTDARTTHGLDEALRRADAFAEAGADVLFVESPESEEEMRTICERFDLPLLANMVEGGRTPVLTKDELQSLGYKIAIFPGSGFLAIAAALDATYKQLKNHGSTAGSNVPFYPFADFSSLMGFDKVYAFDKKYRQD